MNCPKCGLQARISRARLEARDNKVVSVREYSCPDGCRERGCAYRGLGMPFAVREDVCPSEECARLITCCGAVLAKTENGAVTVAPDTEHSEENGVITVKCPVCGKTQTITV